MKQSTGFGMQFVQLCSGIPPIKENAEGHERSATRDEAFCHAFSSACFSNSTRRERLLSFAFSRNFGGQDRAKRKYTSVP